MLSRELIRSGAYLDSFDTLPDDLLWSAERIENSLAETLLKRPDTGDIWIFACGSLIWNPLMEFDREESVTLQGWHRSFCLRIIAGRGSEQAPGRMLALEPGGSTEGVVFRLSAIDLHEELRIVWIREMVAGSYCPTWVPLTLADGSQINAIIFAAEPTREQYESDSSVATIAPLIHTAKGPYGSNADYVFQLEAALADKGLKDDYVAALASELRRLSVDT